MDNYIKYLYGNDTLKAAFKYVVDNNSGWDNPYHNNQHLMCVFDNVMMLASYNNLGMEDKTILGIAALFHDFNHSGGELTDNENIKLAVKGLTDFSSEYIHYDKIVNLIELTEFPHKRPPSTMMEEIMLDADLMVAYQSKDWFNDIIVGLAAEYGNTIGIQLGFQINFISDIGLFTNYARVLQGENTVKLKHDLKYLKTIFE